MILMDNITKVRNLTPHPINIYLRDGTILTLPRDPWMARRVPTRDDPIGMVMGIPFWNDLDFVIKGLPDPVEGTIYVTSASTASFIKRPDVMSVNSGPSHAVYDSHHRQVGVRGLLYYGDRKG